MAERHLGGGLPDGSAADYAPATPPGACGAVVASVEPGSPAERAGLAPGMRVLRAEGEEMADIIDWFWLSDGFEAELEVDDAGTPRTLLLERMPGEQWGFEFADNVFDGVRTCVNACTFCFMSMLPAGMRPGMYLRDDDYRLSFLQGNFVTLTNMDDDDVDRVIGMDLSPIHVSLHAVDAGARRALMGANHARGLEAAEELLEAGIELHTQVVLVPGVNDGAVLDGTLRWAAEHEGVLSMGIVPLGFTRFQGRFDRSFDDPADARAVIEQARPFQEECRRRWGATKIHLADEFYVNAYPDDAELHLPAVEEYDGYPQFHDGIGMLRSLVDDWDAACAAHAPAAGEAAEAGAEPGRVALVCGQALAPLMRRLVARAGFAHVDVLGVDNAFFGGNVDVTGLLTGADVAPALAEWARGVRERGLGARAVLPAAMLNDAGNTLDDVSTSDLAHAAGVPVRVVCYSADEIADAAARF